MIKEFYRASKIFLICLRHPIFLVCFCFHIEAQELKTEYTDTNRVNYLLDLAKKYENYSSDSSCFFAKEAAKLASQLNYYEGIAKSHSFIATFYQRSNRIDSSIMYYQQSVQYFQKTGNYKGIANGYINIGMSYRLDKDYKSSFDFILKAKEIGEQHNDFYILAYANSSLAMVYQSQNEIEEAIRYFEKALSFSAQQQEDKFLAARIYQNMAIAHAINKKYEVALIHFQKAAKIYESANNLFDLSSVLSNIGNIHYLQQNNKKALEYYFKAIAIDKKTGTLNATAKTYNNIGSVYKNENKTDSAIYFVNMAIELYKKSKIFSPLIGLYKNLSELHEQEGNLVFALEFERLSTHINDSLKLNEKDIALADAQTKYETEQKKKEIENLKKQNLIILYSGIGGGILLIIIFVLLFVLNKRNQLRNKSEHEKHQLMLEKKMIELEQKALQSQMNPHFIFNALNSIQAFITSNNTLQAASFLTKFAKLMRLILESSREPLISLEDEIDMLRYYLEIQQLCYGKKFDFKIIVDEQLEIEEIKILPMLVQPYIENAIIHGILNKECQGMITIRFTKQNEFIHIEVEDDGIGREKANIMKKQFGDTFHKSVGLLITQERIEFFNKEKNKQIVTSIIDQKDKNGLSTGTKAVISFPTLYSS